MSDWKQIVRERLAGLPVDGARESDIIDELAQHLEDRYEALRLGGVSEETARRQALEELNDSKLFAEELRKIRRPASPEPIGLERGGYMTGLIMDFKIAARNIRLKPGFSLMVIGMLALGIAGNAAIFSIFNGLFLRPFPFHDAQQLIDLDETAPKWNLKFVGVADMDFYEWRKSNSTFDGMAFFTGNSMNLSGDRGTQRIRAASVTYDLMDVLQLKPVLGRNILPEEDQPGGAQVALLNYDLWKRMFNGDRNVLGRILKLDNEPYTIVGVLPREAVFPSQAELWTPLAAEIKAGNGWYLSGIGRLKHGVSPEQAQADLVRIHKAMIKTGQEVNEITSPVLTPLRDRYLGFFRTVGRILLGAVGIVLLIACVNIAALMMVRASARGREIAIRTAIGASRGRIIRQLLSESVLLAAIGALLGVLLGSLLLDGMVSLMPADNLPTWVTFRLDARFAAFCIAITGAAAIFFGLAPAIQASRVDTRGSLQDAAIRTTHSRGRRATLRGLVVIEVALALVLLISAGLLLQAFQKVLHVDPGFRPENVLTFAVNLPNTKYAKREQRSIFMDSLMERLRPIPGVKAAGAASAIPFGGHWGNFYVAEGDRPLGPNEKTPVVLQIATTPGYFDAIGMTLLSGRTFTERDGFSQDAPVVIVNESFAKAHWPNQDAVGKHIRYSNPKSKWMEVVGVMRDEKHYGLDQEMRPGVFQPHYQLSTGGMTVVLRTSIDPTALMAPARDALRKIDGDLPMYAVHTMSEQLNQSLWARRAYSTLFGAFAVIALILAAAGIYGVLSYAVSQRTQEIGIRMALGAQPGQLLRETLKSGMLLVSIGVVVGILGALGAVKFLNSLLFGVSSRDPLIYGAVIAGVVGVGLLANWIPAHRAASIDPMRALRVE
jgi:predicted permease